MGAFFCFVFPIPGFLILFKYFKVCTKMFSSTNNSRNMPATCRCFYSTTLKLLGLEPLLCSTPLNFINLKHFILCDSRLLTAKRGKMGYFTGEIIPVCCWNTVTEQQLASLLAPQDTGYVKPCLIFLNSLHLDHKGLLNYCRHLTYCSLYSCDVLLCEYLIIFCFYRQFSNHG